MSTTLLTRRSTGSKEKTRAGHNSSLGKDTLKIFEKNITNIKSLSNKKDNVVIDMHEGERINMLEGQVGVPGGLGGIEL